MTKELSQNTIPQFLFPILKPYKWHYFMMFQIPMVAVAFHVLNGYALKLIVDTSTNAQAVATKWDIIYPIVKNKAFIHDAYKFFNDGGVPPPIRRLGPYLPSEKPDNQDWPTLDDPYRTVKNNKLVYCGWCHRVHDNDFIGKLNQDFTEEDKEKYPFKETE